MDLEVNSKLNLAYKLSLRRDKIQKVLDDPNLQNFYDFVDAKYFNSLPNTSRADRKKNKEIIDKYKDFDDNPTNYSDFYKLPSSIDEYNNLVDIYEDLVNVQQINLRHSKQSEDELGIYYNFNTLQNTKSTFIIDSLESLINSTLSDALELNKPNNTNKLFKVKINMECEYVKQGINDGDTNYSLILETDPSRYTHPSQIQEIIKTQLLQVLNKYVEDVETPSGSIFNKLKSFKITLVKGYHQVGSGHLPLPKAYEKCNGSIRNMQNKDNLCFMYSVIQSIHRKELDSDTLKKPKYLRNTYFDKYQWPQYNESGVEININELTIFENNNNIELFIYDNSKNLIYTPHITSEIKHTVYLGFITEETTDNKGNYYEKCHYVTITNINNFLNNHEKNNFLYKGACPSCNQSFKTQEEALDHYRNYCKKMDNIRRQFPWKFTKLNTLSHIRNYQNAPCVIIYDFESLLQEVEDDDGEISQKHIPLSYCICTSWIDRPEWNSSIKLNIAKNEDELNNIIKSFIKDLITLRNKAYKLVKNNRKEVIPSTITRKKTKLCELCNNPENKEIVCDHDHITGNFRYWLCKECNKKLELPVEFEIPVIAHNSSNYDNNLIIKGLTDHNTFNTLNYLEEQCNEGIITDEDLKNSKETLLQKLSKFSIISENSECIKFFSINKLVFKDSFAFLSSSLENLRPYCQVGKDQYEFPTLRKAIKEFNRYTIEEQEELYKYMSQKMDFCYDYFNSVDKVHGNELPSINYFMTKLNGQQISEEAYNEVKLIFNKFCNKSIYTFLELYNISDVCLLADIVQAFRKASIKLSKLDPIRSYTASSHTWNYFLQYMHNRPEYIPELLHNAKLYDFFEIRGGNCFISKRYSVANYPELQNYNPNEEIVNLANQDCNSLYPSSCIYPLPYKKFKFVDNLNTVVGKASCDGYITGINKTKIKCK